MPSGSHGGSSGSHRSGGASFGGHGSSGSSGGSHRGGGPNNHGGPHRDNGWHHHVDVGYRRYRWGRTVYVVPSEKASIITILTCLIFFCFIFSTILAFDVAQSVKDVNNIKNDYYYYQNMISKAENNSEYLKTGFVTDHFLNEDCDKWYFTYKIARDDVPVGWLEGYSYSCYTLEEVSKFEIDSEIEIAVNSKVVTDSTDSIPMDYKNMPLKKDGEYLNCVKERTLDIVLLVSGCVGFVVLIAINIRVFTKYKEKVSNSNSRTKSSNSSYSKSGSAKHCSYCGASVSSNARNCSSCGAKIK